MFSPNIEKYRPEKTPDTYMDTFHAVRVAFPLCN